MAVMNRLHLAWREEVEKAKARGLALRGLAPEPTTATLMILKDLAEAQDRLGAALVENEGLRRENESLQGELIEERRYRRRLTEKVRKLNTPSHLARRVMDRLKELDDAQLDALWKAAEAERLGRDMT